MSNSIKTSSINKIITINNKIYIPFPIHNIPKKYQEIDLSSQFNLNGFTYILIDELLNNFTTKKQLLNKYKLNSL